MCVQVNNLCVHVYGLYTSTFPNLRALRAELRNLAFQLHQQNKYISISDNNLALVIIDRIIRKFCVFYNHRFMHAKVYLFGHGKAYEILQEKATETSTVQVYSGIFHILVGCRCKSAMSYWHSLLHRYGIYQSRNVSLSLNSDLTVAPYISPPGIDLCCLVSWLLMCEF